MDLYYYLSVSTSELRWWTVRTLSRTSVGGLGGTSAFPTRSDRMPDAVVGQLSHTDGGVLVYSYQDVK